MKRRRYQIAALVALAGFGGLFLVMPSSGSGVDVKMTASFRFRPERIRIDVGGAVTFTNESEATHTATCQSCPQDTGDVQPQQFKTLTFTRPGQYLLFCRYHGEQGMVAAITVGSGATPQPSPPATVTPSG